MNALEAALRSGHVLNGHLALYDARVDATIFDEPSAQQPWLQAEFLLSTGHALQPACGGQLHHGCPAPSTTSFASLVGAQPGGGALARGGDVHHQASLSAGLGASEAQAAAAAGLGSHLHAAPANQNSNRMIQLI